MILQNALVYTPRHTFERGTIVIRDGRIVPFAAPEEGEEVLDAEGLYALPGLVDIHFHGAMGKDFCDGTEEAIQTLADFEASKGVLAICPATMTYPEEILNKVMDAAAAHKNGKGADLVGINMEGPFISPKKVGAQNPEYVQGADAAMFRRLQKRANGLIKLVDVAPEEPGNLDFIKECHNEVRISIAHTCTDYDTAVKAFEAADAIKNGADEIDMVINLSMVKDGCWVDVANDIRAVREATRGKILKVIIECCLLTDEEKIHMCRIVADCGADFIKTSTGFSKGGATREDVKLMRANCPASVKVKAAGGISSLKDAEDFIELGAERLGTSRIVKLAMELENEVGAPNENY